MKQIVALLAILVYAGAVRAQKHKPDPLQYVKQDTITAIPSQQLVSLSESLMDAAYKSIRGKDKIDLDVQLKRLTEPDAKKLMENCYELSSSAMMMMGAAQDKNIAIVLASAPIRVLPGDGLLVSNFTALLRMLDSVRASLPVLVYAKGLAPKSPIVLTNLANTCFELGDDRSAEVFYKRALKIDEHFRDARSGLVAVYLKRKDLGSAYAELMRGVEEVTYSENTHHELDRTSNDHGRQSQSHSNTQTPPPPENPPPSDDASGSGGTPDQLVLPPFPEWSDLKAFMHAEGPSRWDKEISKGLQACIAEIQSGASKRAAKFQALTKLPYDQQLQMMNAMKNNPLAKKAERNEYGMDVMQQYMEDRFYQVMNTYKETEEKNGEKFEKSFKQISDAFGIRSEALAKTMEGAGPAGLKALPAYQELMVEYCKQTKLLEEDRFQDWKKNARIWHNKTNDLLHEYWAYCEKYLDHVYGDDYERLTNKRMLYVYGKLSILSGAYSIMPLSFTAAFTNAGGDCAEGSPFPEAGGGADLATTVPKKSGPPCPFDGKVKVPFGPGKFIFNCESFELEAGEGLIGSIKWNSRTRVTTIGAFMGFEGEFSTMGASFKQGMTMSFDRNGQPADVALVQEATGRVIGAGGRSIKMTVAAVAGVDLDIEKEITMDMTPSNYHH